MRKLLSFLALSILIGINLAAQNYHVRIGTIGNSITQGSGLLNPEVNAYPPQLNGLLSEIYGDTCIVTNFGLTTTTMLKNGDVSYWDTQELIDYLGYAPEICLILLGTNDTKYYNWDEHGDEFIGDYLALIDTIKQRNPYTKFMFGYPPPAFQVVFDIRNDIIVNGVIPAVDSVLKVVDDAILVDFYTPLLDDEDLFPDKIHPNTEGALEMAKILRDVIVAEDLVHEVELGLTFITSYETEANPIAKGESTTLSWTSLNADSVFLNGQYVDSIGNKTVSPTATTDYTLIAKGQKSSDTITITLEVYPPELTRLELKPPRVSRYAGDTIFFELLYLDQADREMLDTTFAVNWELSKNVGTLYGTSDTSAYYATPLESDTLELTVSYEDLIGKATINIWPNSNLAIGSHTKFKGKLFPNPAYDQLTIELDNNSKLEGFKIYDIKGSLLLEKSFADLSDRKVYSVNLTGLEQGTYFITMKSNGEWFTQKFLKKDVK